PADGPLYGRLRGLTLVRLESGVPVVIVAVDGARITSQHTSQLASSLAIPAENIFVWSGGRAFVDLPVDAAAAAVRGAIRRAEPGTWRMAAAPVWSLRAADPDSPLLAGQRLTRSHRQLRNRAPDPVLEALVERINGVAPPPGGAWGEFLTDHRMMVLGAWRSDGRPLGAIGWWPGRDLFVEHAWVTTGARGHAARQWSERLSSAEHRVPVVVVGPDVPGRLGGVQRLASDPRDAIRRSERSGEAAARVLARIHDAATVVSSVRMARRLASPEDVPLRASPTPSVPLEGVSDPVATALLGLDDRLLVSVPGRLSLGLRLRLERALDEKVDVFWSGPAEGDWGALRTPRESHHAGQSTAWEASSGVWLADELAALDGAARAVREPLQWEADDGERAAPVLPLETGSEPRSPSPQLQARMRRESRRGGGHPVVRLEARWRLPDEELPLPPGDRWQVRLEWEKNKQLQPVFLRGTPVDDLHQGMRFRVSVDRSGRQMWMRWSAPEPPRWSGRTFVLRVGPAYGGPLVSGPLRVK
ncbi:MAG TPA: hypothetical protein DFR83_28910, partial [Deltaproteobacteria bacterium]|nr:hypothetical protein [Deltaproteobacteria bacterium]